MNMELLISGMNILEKATGKTMSELNHQLEDDIWTAIDNKETHKYSYYLNQLKLTLDDYNSNNL